MCGICGLYQKNLSEQEIRIRIEKMNKALIHRGPDGHGIYLDENIAYSDKSNADDVIFVTKVKKNLEENKEEMLKFAGYQGDDQDNQIYLNAVLIENNKMYNKAELKRYIKYKSTFLGKNIDMILLFREEFSNN